MTHGGPTRRQRRSQDLNDAYDDDDDSSSMPPPPDGGWGWIVVFASFAIHVVTDGVTYSFGVLQLELTDYFNAGQGEAAWVVSILTGVTLCSGPLSSAFVNKYGCRLVTMAGAAIATVCLAVSWFATNIATLYVTLGLGTGLGFGLIYLPAIVSVTCYFDKYRSMATGIAVCGSGLGTFIFAPLIGHLIKEYGWRGTLLIIAGLVFETAVMGALFRPLEDNSGSSSRTTEKDAKSDPSKVEMTELKTLLPNGTDATKENSQKLIVPRIQWPNSTGHLNVNGDIRSRSLDHHMNTRHIKGKSLHFTDQANNAHSNHHHHHHPHHHHHHHSHHQHSRDIARLARSQPTLQMTGGGSTSMSTHHLAGAGVMYRKDIFYQRSLINIPHHGARRYGIRTAEVPAIEDMDYASIKWLTGGPIFQSIQLKELTEPSQTSTGGAVTGGSTKAIGSTGSGSEADEDSMSDRAIMCGCVPCSRETKDTLTEMLDFSLFKDKIFVIFTISNLLTSIGFYVPFVYIKHLGKSVGVPDDTADYLISVVGVANTVGRIVLGYLSDKPWINRLFVYNASLTICGVATVLAAFCGDFNTLAIYASVFGFTIGAYVGLTSVILVDLLGLDKLTNAFGLLLLFQGIASLLGAPIGGWLYDITNTYTYAFYLSGITIALSGLMLFFIKGPERSTSTPKGQSIKPSDANTNGKDKTAIAAV